MIKFEKIKEGMTLWDCKKRKRFGISVNTSKWQVWPVHIKKVDTERRRVFASWNYNAPRWIPERRVTKYRAKAPKE